MQIISASALLVISFPNSLPTSGRLPKLKAALFSSVVLISISLISGCLSTLMQMRYEKSNRFLAPIDQKRYQNKLTRHELDMLYKLIP